MLPGILPESLPIFCRRCCRKSCCQEYCGVVAGGDIAGLPRYCRNCCRRYCRGAWGGWKRAVEIAPKGACGRHKVHLRGLERGEGVAAVSLAVFAAVSDCVRCVAMEFVVTHVTLLGAMVGLVAGIVAVCLAVCLAGDVAGIVIPGNLECWAR